MNMLCEMNEGFFKIFIFGPRCYGKHVSMVTGSKNEKFEKSLIHFTEHVHTNISAKLFKILINRYGDNLLQLNFGALSNGAV